MPWPHLCRYMSVEGNELTSDKVRVGEFTLASGKQLHSGIIDYRAVYSCTPATNYHDSYASNDCTLQPLIFKFSKNENLGI